MDRPHEWQFKIRLLAFDSEISSTVIHAAFKPKSISSVRHRLLTGMGFSSNLCATATADADHTNRYVVLAMLLFDRLLSTTIARSTASSYTCQIVINSSPSSTCYSPVPPKRRKNETTKSISSRIVRPRLSPKPSLRSISQLSWHVCRHPPAHLGTCSTGGG